MSNDVLIAKTAIEWAKEGLVLFGELVKSLKLKSRIDRVLALMGKRLREKRLIFLKESKVMRINRIRVHVSVTCSLISRGIIKRGNWFRFLAIISAVDSNPGLHADCPSKTRLGPIS